MIQKILFTNNLEFIRKQELGGIFDTKILEERPGILIFSCSGKGTENLFKNESGGHRWQRIPPTEKKGRMQTSTITVCVFKDAENTSFTLVEREIEEQFTRGSGAGGQHRNTTDSAVILKHIPTGITVRVEGERSQKMNREIARKLIYFKIQSKLEKDNYSTQAKMRKDQVGSGMRGDKIRTVRTQDNIVTCHKTNQKIKYSDYIKGNFSF